jgi:hypothetical protein
LDLLLDTVCNLFGVMIFVAIVAAILAGPPDRPLDKSMDTTPLVASPITIVDPDPRLIETDRQLRAARAELSRRNKVVAEWQELRRQVRDAAIDVAAYMAVLRAEVEDLEVELQLKTDQKDIVLRTPRQRELAEMIPVQIVLTGGRAYVVNDWTGLVDIDPIGERCIGWTTWNINSVDARRSQARVHYCWRAGGQDIERRIILRRGGGVAVIDTAQLQVDPTWNHEMSWFDPEVFIINFKVAPDSFEEYGAVRADIANRGLHYDVEVIPSGLVYEDRLMEGLATAQ